MATLPLLLFFLFVSRITCFLSSDKVEVSLSNCTHCYVAVGTIFDKSRTK